MLDRANDPKTFLSKLEARANQPQFVSRRRYSAAQLRQLIQAERRRERERGEEWTIWRQFYCVEEATSPNRCDYWDPRFWEPCCTVIATWVAYHTRKAEKIRLCNGHMERHLQESTEHAQQDE